MHTASLYNLYIMVLFLAAKRLFFGAHSAVPIPCAHICQSAHTITDGIIFYAHYLNEDKKNSEMYLLFQFLFISHIYKANLMN